MTDFPTGIEHFDASTFAEGMEDPAVTGGEMQGGFLLSRPRFTRPGRRTFDFQYVDMTQADKEVLRIFYSEITHGSSLAFNWTHPITGAIHNVRFDPQLKMAFKRSGYGTNHRWDGPLITVVEV